MIVPSANWVRWASFVSMVASALMRIEADGLERRERLGRDLHRRSSVRATGREKATGERNPGRCKDAETSPWLGEKREEGS